jgi:RNA polymerase subunit RPABC4/transcription elongation factor Spt4
MESIEAAGSATETCPHCQAAVTPDEKFCAACGRALVRGISGTLIVSDPPASAMPPPPVLSYENAAKIGKARKWLFAIALLTMLTGVIFYFIQKADVEKQIDEARIQVAGIPPDVLDERFKAATGMTWQEAIDHDRGLVYMLLAVNLALGALYLVLWWWAKTKPLPAAVIALLLFITTHVINAVMQPASIYQGILVKILFTLALVRAITAAKEERNLTAAPIA